MADTPTRTVLEHGQSIWFDYIERRMIFNGELHRMIEEEGLRGITSNPSIFEKAMATSSDYLPAMRQVVELGASAQETFEHLAVQDIQWTCDVFRSVYDETEGRDGFVSLEVSPHFAHDTLSTIEEAHRLWEMVGRANLMVKVPGTEEGLPAIEQLLCDGINVNVTLLFSVERYQKVFDAYLTALERRRQQGESIDRIASVASFFVSRIDTKIDTMLAEGDAAGRDLMGKVAVANAKRAYAHFKEVTASERYRSLMTDGARPQRLLWASTSTKNPDYSDTLYVDQLIGSETVNTIPAATYGAFNDHGTVAATLQDGPDQAETVLERLNQVGVDLERAASELEVEGVQLFADAYDRLISSVESRRKVILGSRIARLSAHLGEHGDRVQQSLQNMAASQVARRLWDRDGTLFGSDDADHAHASSFMGWLDLADDMDEEIDAFDDLQDDLVEEGVESVVLMGMGGSSLAPDVWLRTFGQLDGHPELLVLDSTSPTQVSALEAAVDLTQTVFTTASKSGTTAEPRAFDSYFFHRVATQLAASHSDLLPGDRFMAITDPGSQLEEEAFDRDYRAIFNGEPEVGGRFSALSPFGLIPLAAMGVDVGDFLLRARRMVGSCHGSVPPSENEGLKLGAILGELAKVGRNKLTLIPTPGLAAFGAWLEQLVAESTGKHGQGIIPVDGEVPSDPDDYGSDRLFVFLGLDDEETEGRDEAAQRLVSAGHPVVRIRLDSPMDLGQEMFRWEMATAVAGHLLGINPFDQPNVQESKDFTKQLLQRFENSGSLMEPELLTAAEGDGLSVQVGSAQAEAVGHGSVAEVVARHLARAEVPDYVAINAFLPMLPEVEDQVSRLRERIRALRPVATTVGFGPRFLHSTGQLHKGGPDRGVFVHLWCEESDTEAIPEATYGFGTLMRAQELGDFMALDRRGRRIIRVGLGSDPVSGLQKLVDGLH